MKIAVDGYELGREARGVGRVIDNILIPLFDLLPGAEFLIYTKESIGKYSHPRASEQVLPSPGGYLRWQNGPLRRALKKAKPDYFVATNYILPLIAPWKSVLIEHDISAVSHPEWYPRRYTFTRRFLIKRSLEKAAFVVVPSEFIKSEIVVFFDLTPEKIKVLGWGIEEKFRRAPEESALAWKEKKGLKGKKVVGYLGFLNKRRHIPSLVQAVGSLRKDFPEIILYIVGKDLSGSRSGEMAQALNQDWIKWEATLAEEELPLYYSSLDAFAFLSEYEGFGFPPLEALACGTPAVLLRRSSLQEIYSDVAFMVEKPDTEEVTEVLRTALTDKTECRHLLEMFEKKRSQFSWLRTAREFSLILRDINST
jgi:glycosyltransferase involved in cell wall biosynthesis